MQTRRLDWYRPDVGVQVRQWLNYWREYDCSEYSIAASLFDVVVDLVGAEVVARWSDQELKLVGRE